MARRRRRSRSPLKTRPNHTCTRMSWSPQTVTSGSPSQKDITDITSGNPADWWKERDKEVVVSKIEGVLIYVPNLNEETGASAELESWSAYAGIIRVDVEQAGNALAQMDPFNEPDRPYIWKGQDKGGYVIPATGALTDIMFPFGGAGHLWRINLRPNIKLSQRERLIVTMNYTADGDVLNSSWRGAFWTHVRY